MRMYAFEGGLYVRLLKGTHVFAYVCMLVCTNVCTYAFITHIHTYHVYIHACVHHTHLVGESFNKYLQGFGRELFHALDNNLVLLLSLLELTYACTHVCMYDLNVCMHFCMHASMCVWSVCMHLWMLVVSGFLVLM
jgi:hypothetical protein